MKNRRANPNPIRPGDLPQDSESCLAAVVGTLIVMAVIGWILAGCPL